MSEGFSVHFSIDYFLHVGPVDVVQVVSVKGFVFSLECFIPGVLFFFPSNCFPNGSVELTVTFLSD